MVHQCNAYLIYHSIRPYGDQHESPIPRIIWNTPPFFGGDKIIWIPYLHKLMEHYGAANMQKSN